MDLNDTAQKVDGPTVHLSLLFFIKMWFDLWNTLDEDVVLTFMDLPIIALQPTASGSWESLVSNDMNSLRACVV